MGVPGGTCGYAPRILHGGALMAVYVGLPVGAVGGVVVVPRAFDGGVGFGPDHGKYLRHGRGSTWGAEHDHVDGGRRRGIPDDHRGPAGARVAEVHSGASEPRHNSTIGADAAARIGRGASVR